MKDQSMVKYEIVVTLDMVVPDAQEFARSQDVLAAQLTAEMTEKLTKSAKVAGELLASRSILALVPVYIGLPGMLINIRESQEEDD